MDEQNETVPPIQPVIEQSAQPAPQPKPKKITKQQLAEQGKQRRKWAERKQAQRDREKAFEQEAISSTTEVLNDKAAKVLIVSEWGISREYLIDIIHEEGKRAAEQLRIPATSFYWSNGPVATLASIKSGTAQPLEKCDDENAVIGEITYRKEIFALYHFMEAWRDNAIPTFAEYLAERRSCKTDGTINRGNKYFGKDFHEQPHQRWDDMFISWNPDGLTADYTQEDAKKWLASQSENKKRVLVACRNSYKSNFTLVYLVGAVLCCPDIRLLLVSETKPLSKSFINGFRSFWEIKNPNAPTRFQRLFREFCIPLGDGSSLEFKSPMAHLDLFQPCANSTSMEAGGWAGSRADIILFDDPISNNTVGTDDQREKSVVKYDAILELLEVGGYTHYNATPWHEDDLTARILERNEKSDDKALLHIIDPAWTVNESGKGKDIFELAESDVELLFPERLTWKVLRQKLKDGDPKGRTFRMQSLCMFLPEVEEGQKLQFDKDVLARNVLAPELIPPTDEAVYASGDLGFSKSRYADPSAFTILKVAETKLYVLDQIAGNWRDSEKAQKIVEMQRKYPSIKMWVIEKYPSFERLAEDVRMEAMRYGIIVNIRWVNADNKADAKFRRLKSIETYVAQGRVKFQAGIYTADLFVELEKLDDSGPKRRSSSIKDDRGDSLGLGIQFFMPSPDEEDAALRQKFLEEMEEKENRIRQYNRIFGSASITEALPPEDYQQDPNDNPIYSALKPLNQVRPAGDKKIFTFGYMKEKPHKHY